MARSDGRRGRVPLSRERILRTAVDLADAEGLAAVTMRSLAGRLRVEAMSLYNHVANKDDLVDGMLESIAAEIGPPPPDLTWRAEVRHRAVAIHDALVSHRWASLPWATSTSTGPQRMQLVEGQLRVLREAGFPPGTLDLAFHTIQNHVVGHALQRANFPIDPDELPEATRRLLRDFPSDEFPELAAHIRYHQEQPPGASAFEYALDLILDGLEQELDDARRDAH